MNRDLETTINNRVKTFARQDAVGYFLLYGMTVCIAFMWFAAIGSILFFRMFEIMSLPLADIAGVALGILITRGFIPVGLAKRMRAHHQQISDNYAASLWRSARCSPEYYRGA